jgi:hypothetical protein
MTVVLGLGLLILELPKNLGNVILGELLNLLLFLRRE